MGCWKINGFIFSTDTPFVAVRKLNLGRGVEAGERVLCHHATRLPVRSVTRPDTGRGDSLAKNLCRRRLWNGRSHGATDFPFVAQQPRDWRDACPFSKRHDRHGVASAVRSRYAYVIDVL